MTEYWFERGFNEDTMRRFNVRYDHLDRCLIWPIKNEDQNTISFCKRFLPETSASKYLYPAGFERTFFPMDHLDPSNGVILVEGPLDALWLHQHGYAGLAMLGSGLTGAQRAWLEARVRSIIIATDNDFTGRRGRCQLFKTIGRTIKLRLGLVENYDRKDVQELTEIEIADLITNALSPVEYADWCRVHRGEQRV